MNYLDKERYLRIKDELRLDWSDVSYVVNQNDIKWMLKQCEKLDKIKDLVNCESLTKSETVDKISEIVNA